MIRNIKTHNIFSIIEISKPMEPNKYTHKKIMKIFIKVFPMIFQSLMGPNNQGVTVPSGTTQGNSYPFHLANTLMGLSRIQYYYWLNF